MKWLRVIRLFSFPLSRTGRVFAHKYWDYLCAKTMKTKEKLLAGYFFSHFHQSRKPKIHLGSILDSSCRSPVITIS